jgi:hypothetical protein
MEEWCFAKLFWLSSCELFHFVYLCLFVCLFRGLSSWWCCCHLEVPTTWCFNWDFIWLIVFFFIFFVMLYSSFFWFSCCNFLYFDLAKQSLRLLYPCIGRQGQQKRMHFAISSWHDLLWSISLIILDPPRFIFFWQAMQP